MLVDEDSIVSFFALLDQESKSSCQDFSHKRKVSKILDVEDSSGITAM